MTCGTMQSLSLKAVELMRGLLAGDVEKFGLEVKKHRGVKEEVGNRAMRPSSYHSYFFRFFTVLSSNNTHTGKYFIHEADKLNAAPRNDKCCVYLVRYGNGRFHGTQLL